MTWLYLTHLFATTKNQAFLRNPHFLLDIPLPSWGRTPRRGHTTPNGPRVQIRLLTCFLKLVRLGEQLGRLVHADQVRDLVENSKGIEPPHRRQLLLLDLLPCLEPEGALGDLFRCREKGRLIVISFVFFEVRFADFRRLRLGELEKSNLLSALALTDRASEILSTLRNSRAVQCDIIAAGSHDLCS